MPLLCQFHAAIDLLLGFAVMMVMGFVYVFCFRVLLATTDAPTFVIKKFFPLFWQLV